MTSLGTLFRGQRSLYVRDLLRELVVRDIKLRYKRSILGMAWSLLNPLFQLAVLVFVFQRALRLDIPNYASFAFTGVLAYNWFQTALFEAAMSITGNRELVRLSWANNAIRPRFRWLPTNNPKGLFILNDEFSTEENTRPAKATDFSGANIGKQFGWVGRSPPVYA